MPERSRRSQAFFFLAICASWFGLSPALGAEAFTAGWVPAVTDQPVPTDYSPAPVAQNKQHWLMAAPGEFRPTSFVVHAVRDLEALEVDASGLRNSAGELLPGALLDIRIVKYWYQSSFGGGTDKNLRYLRPELLLYDDGLVRAEDGENYLRLVDGQYIHISGPGNFTRRVVTPVARMPVQDATTLQPAAIGAGTSRQFWVTLHVPEDAVPGVYAAEVRLRDERDTLRTLPLTVEVLPIKLREPDIDISIYYRGVLDASMPEGSISSEVKSETQYLAELRNMAEHGIRSPTIYQKYPTGKLDRVLELWDEAGLMLPRRLFYLGLTVVTNNTGNVPANLAPQVREIRAKAARYGINDVNFYARDEARGAALTYQLPFWNEVRRAGGGILAAGWQSDARQDGNFDTNGGEEDIFASLGTVRRSESSRWHSKGRLIYSYQNPTVGYELPETYRRNYGLLLWQMNYDGAIPYAYQDAEGRAWHEFDSAKNREMSFTYPTIDKPIDTVQWEGFREGVDDLRYLATLQHLLTNTQGEVADAARSWLAELKESVLAQQDLDAIRDKIIAFILALQGDAGDSAVIPPESIHVSRLQGDGTATIAWQFDGRDQAAVWLQAGTGSWQRAAESLAMSRAHAVSIELLAADSQYRFRITPVDAETAGPILAEGQFSTSRDLQLQSVAAVQTGNVIEVQVDVSTDYDASLVVDWQNSLLGWWRFSSAKNGIVDDASGGSKSARLQGGAKLAPGRFGNGVALDGTNGFISMPDISIPENGAGTVEGWFRIDRFAMEERTNIGLFTGLYQHASNNHLYISRTNEHFSAGDRLQAGVWHHLAYTWNGDASTAVLYIDGHRLPVIVLGDIENVPAINGLAVGRNSGYLGGLIRPVPGSLAGGVDEVRVWNRPLSHAEVQTAWSAGRNPKLRLEFPVPESGRAEWVILGANEADQTVRSAKQTVGR